MLIERSRIPAEGLDLSLEEEPQWEDLEDVWRPLGVVEARVHLEPRREGILATGAFAATGEVLCSRCSEPVPLRLEDQFEVLFLTMPLSEVAEELELTAEEMDVAFLQNDRLDLSALLRENILLSLPVQPLCHAGCRGLCPRCGANLNETSCRCRVTDLDPRLLTLRQLL